MQYDRTQRRAQNLRLREFRARLKILARIQANRNTIGNTAATARTLIRTRLTDRLNRKSLYLRTLRITRNTGGTRINHITNARYRQRRFSHIRSDHNTLMIMRLKHTMLLLGRQSCEQGHNLNRIRTTHINSTRAIMMTQRILKIMNVALAGSEHENIARSTVMTRMNHQFGTGACHSRRHINIRLARILRIGGGRQCFIVSIARHRASFKTRHGTHQRGSGTQRLIHDLHGVGAPRNLDNRYFRMQSMFEMLLELHRINRRRRDHQFQITTFRQQCSQISKKKINIETTFMRFVNNDRIVLHQLRITLNLRQQNTVRHHTKTSLRRTFIGETHLIADLVTQTHAHLRGDTFGYGTRGQPTRLRVHDLPAMRSATQFQQNLRQLRGLTGTSLTGNNHHLARLHRLGNIAARSRNRQLGRIFEFHAFITSITRKPFELAYLLTS